MEEKSKSILFLHGFTQNSTVFRNRIKVLLNALDKNFKNINYLIPDAPFIVEDNFNSEEIKRGWLYLDESNKSNCIPFEKEKEVVYLGLNESLQTLIKLNEENNMNIECIIGFSQGSLLATFLSILTTRKELLGEKFPNLKCLILVAGFIYPLPKNEEIKFYYHNIENLYQNVVSVNPIEESLKIQTPSLHVYGSSDPYISPEKSEKLTNLFSNVETHVHEGKHYIPTKKDNIEAYVNFLNKYLSK